ncbi:unnamed protein product [Caenorhabditis angaria]|uniref:Glycine N-acyltransferase-like protein n=1 Tax=Caenorhabditis angaria TaxID=860376 RepID=A0A9P1N9P4_9PELO|nr:unnamed protein product [Caenorhabditis angaria]
MTQVRKRMHASLFEVTTREHFARVKALTSKHIETIYFPFSIQTEIEKSFPESPIRLFVYPCVANPKYVFMFKNNLYIKPYCAIALFPDHQIDRLEMIDLICEFRTRVFGTKRQAHLMIAEELIIKLYGVAMRMGSTDWNHSDLKLSLFYMTDSNKKIAMKSQLPKLPMGYYYDDIDPSEEAEHVNNTWKHAGPGDLEQTTAKLNRLPSSCIRFDGQPVAFEMIDPAGFFNNQYVFEDHRRKGLGNAVEIDLIQKAIRSGMSPFKTVANDNHIVLEASVASKFWTQWCDKQSGKPQSIVFQTWEI